MNNKKLVEILMCCFGFVLIGVGLSYAEWISRDIQDSVNVAKSECFSMSLIGNSDALLLENDFPKEDNVGMERDPFTFTVKNTCDTDASYQIKVEMQDDNSLDHELIKVALDNNISLLSSLKNVDNNYYVIGEDFLMAGDSKEYNFRQWFDISGNLDNSQQKRISTKIVIKSVPISNYPLGTEVLESLFNNGDETLVNDDPDHNIRYTGSNPYNYVSFNGELWRIIGSFNNIKTTENGVGEKRLKISLIEYLEQFDYGRNSERDWSKNSTQNNLNGSYYDSLSSDAKLLIGEALWNLGGIPEYVDTTAPLLYNDERGINVYGDRPTFWVGNVALIYMSDYVYAINVSSSERRDECLSSSIYDWNNAENRDCSRNNYLLASNGIQPLSSYYDSSLIPGVSSDGGIPYAIYNGSNYPTLFLKSNVKIIDGTG